MSTTKLSILFSVCLLIVLCKPALAQHADEKTKENESKSAVWENLFLGGNFGMQFGTYTYIDISPLLGYRITNRLSAGPGVTYRYVKVRGFESSSTYGGRLFARHTVGQQFFVHTEYESLNTWVYQDLSQRETVRAWVPGLFIGGGIFQPVGRRASVVIYGLYNVMYDNLRSPYASPWVFNVGLVL